MPIRQSTFSFAASIRIATALALTSVAAPTAHGHGRHARAARARPTPEEIAAFGAAKPAFERHCFRCHTTTGKKSKRKALDHISMDGYPFGGHHADEAGKVVRKVLGADGKSKATMPSDDKGAVAGDDLTKIVAWADAFDRTHAEKPAPSTHEEHSHAR